MGNRDFITFDFDQLKRQKSCKKIYKESIWKFFNKNKDCVFTVITEHDSSHMLHRHIEDFFIKHTLRNAYIRDNNILYVETYNNRSAAIKDKYIVVPKKLRLE